MAMTENTLRPIIIHYCIKCDVNARHADITLITHFNELQKQGDIEHMQWGECKRHQPQEPDTLVSVYISWQSIPRKR